MGVKKEIRLVTCMECEHADLLQYYKNPVIASCRARDGLREVAAARRCCDRWKRRERAPEIKMME